MFTPLEKIFQKSNNSKKLWIGKKRKDEKMKKKEKKKNKRKRK
jgi:hypothetical protein